jgi:AcrR family transcriptional regulator
MNSGHPEAEPNTKPGTRERLLDVAERVFAEQGFAGASVRAITDGAGANLGAVNYYFQSKENLYLEVFRRGGSRLRERLVAAVRSETGSHGNKLEGAFATFGHAFVGPHADSAYRQRLIDLCWRESAEDQLPPGTFQREIVTPMVETLMGLVRQGRPGLDEATARACAHSFLAQLLHVARGAHVAARRKTGLPSPEERIAFIARFTAAAVRHI